MSRLRLFHKGGGLSFDTRFGTAVDSSGWFTFGLNAGNRQVFLNGGRADDSGDGLSPGAAKKTFAAAWAVLKAGNPGDQLMVAINNTYTDSGDASGSGSWTNFGYMTTTLAASYPTAVLSYDPADAANGAKYGRATGSNMPILNIPTNGNIASLMVFGNSGTSGYAIQGLEISGNDHIGFIGSSHDGICIQNTRWNTCELNINANSSSATSYANRVNVSKSSFWGAWATDGNKSGLLVQGIDGGYFQDLVFVNSGWEVGVTRSTAASSGGPNGFGHGFYYYPNCKNGHIDRFVGIDAAADSLNCRGGAAITQFVALDEPIVATIGGSSSGDYTNEAPNGVTITMDDAVIMGGDDINSGAPMGIGFGFRNVISGSHIRNVAMFDNPKNGGPVNAYTGGGNDNAAISMAVLLDKIHGYNYSTWLANLSNNTNPNATTWTNAIIDTAISGTSQVDGGGNSTSNGSTFSGYKTRDQVVTAALNAMSITPGASYTARKAQLVNLLLWRPDQVTGIVQTIMGIGLPAMNLTPTYPTGSAPNLSAESPRAVY